jgi:hypothetical protein
MFYTYSYNHAHRLRLEKLLYLVWGFLEVPTDILNRFWIQVAVLLPKPPHGGFRSETVVTQQFQKRNGYKFITVICNGHSPTDTGARSGVLITVV